MGRGKAAKHVMTYEEMSEKVKDEEITIFYDGLCRKGRWYDDHMMKMFSGCRLLYLVGSEYTVMEWPKKEEK